MSSAWQAATGAIPRLLPTIPEDREDLKCALIFDSLLERDEKGLIPWLAERLYADEDGGRTYRFIIRQGVRWQDGQPLTPQDVAFSLGYANRQAATWSYIFDAIETVAVDEAMQCTYG